MDIVSANLKLIVVILTMGFAYATILGYLAHRLKLSPILGYLLAGFLIGPFSPGFVADLKMSEQLAEIGVILMMFGVGLHFKWQDLISTRYIAIPGALVQTAIATLAATLMMLQMGWSIEAGILLGFAVGVASTVVLVRVLADNHLLHTKDGHICVGWLVVEDIITVIVLLMIPVFATFVDGGNISNEMIAWTILWQIGKFVALVILMFTFGKQFVSYALSKIKATQSQELFTLAILALTFVIAAGASIVFGVSITLGAFIAGMAMGQSHLHQQVAINAKPLRDAFVALFFLSIGMLFNPSAITEHWQMFLLILSIILIVKPLAAFLIAIVLRQSIKTGLVIALALAQIGEFSFILAEEAVRIDLIPDEGYDIVVACAIVSIALNPILFKFLPKGQRQQHEAPEL
ncbi:MAG: cation:proton antiporter [Parachlamydiaceae bacterium]|nr:cation:proton antiporter [Parachlamydiaceae bacterium]